MNLTTFFRLRKPEGSDPVDVKDFNDNFDVIDKELNDRPKKTGNAGDMTTAFTQAASRTNLVSGEKLSTSLGKVSKFFADLKTVAFSGKYGDLSGVPALGGAAAMGVADNDTTNNKNFLPTARIVYEHGQEIDQLSSNMASGQIEFDLQDGKGVYRQKGADTWIPFKKGATLKELGAITSYDMKTLTDDYVNLTSDNFFITCSSFTGAWSQGASAGNSLNGNRNMSASLSKNYNPDTGVLTVTISKYQPSQTGDPWYSTTVSVNYSVWVAY